MRIRSQRDFWAGLLFMAIAAAFIVIASNYRMGTAQRMGPGMFPTFVGSVLAVLGLLITVRSFVLPGGAIDRVGARQLVVTLLAVVVFAFALSHLGLAAAIVALTIVGSAADRTVRPLEAVLLAVFLAVFSVLMFVYLLGLPLQVWPEGFPPAWLTSLVPGR